MKSFRSLRLRTRNFPAAAFALALAVTSSLSAAPPAKLPSFVTTAPTPISCDGTPFSHYVTLDHDDEMITEAAISNGNRSIDESTQTLCRTIRSTLFPPTLAGSQFQKGVALDFNGDGKDEIVTANRLSNGNLMLGV